MGLEAYPPLASLGDRPTGYRRSPDPRGSIVRARGVHAALGVMLGSFLPFQTAWLVGEGFTAGEVGLVAAMISIGVTALAPMWARFADLRVGLRGGLMAGVILAFAGLTVGLYTSDRLLIGVALTGSAVCLIGVSPLADAIAMRLLVSPSADMGRVRLFGAGSFGIAALFLGLAFSVYGSWIVLVSFGAALATLAWALSKGSIEEHRERAASTAHALVRRRSKLGMILLANTIAHAGTEAGYTFFGPRLVELGAGVAVVGVAQSVSVAGEVTALYASSWVLRRIGLARMFGVAVACYAVVMVCWAFAESPLLLVATRFVSGVGIGWMMLATVLTIGGFFSSSRQGTAQSLNVASSMGFGPAVGTFVGGLVYANGGPAALFVAAAAVACVGAAIGVVAIGERTALP